MIAQNDVVIKSIIEIGLDEMRNNPYLIKDALEVFDKNPLLSKKYAGEINNAIEWIKTNSIDVVMRYRNDKDTFPLVTITMGEAPQMVDMNRLNDDLPDDESVVLLPNDIKKPIPYMVNPFTPTEYDPETGFVGLPKTVRTARLRSGMILVDPATGNGWVITGTNGGVYIEPGSQLTGTQLAVVPKNAFYKARKKSKHFKENWVVSCHAHGDMSKLLWLHTMVFYVLLRYTTVLERNSFTELVISNGAAVPNQDWGQVGGEMIYSRNISISGTVENSWLDEPGRIIEAVDVTDSQPDGYKAGIKILSNLDSPDDLDTDQDSWTTVKDK